MLFFWVICDEILNKFLIIVCLDICLIIIDVVFVVWIVLEFFKNVIKVVDVL